MLKMEGGGKTSSLQRNWIFIVYFKIKVKKLKLKTNKKKNYTKQIELHFFLLRSLLGLGSGGGGGRGSGSSLGRGSTCSRGSSSKSSGVLDALLNAVDGAKAVVGLHSDGNQVLEGLDDGVGNRGQSGVSNLQTDGSNVGQSFTTGEIISMNKNFCFF